MLKGIPSILSPELLKILMEMGHGDEIVIADGNYPSGAHPEHVVRLDGHGVPEILGAILKFFPLDRYVDTPVTLMEVVAGDPVIPVIWEEFKKIIATQEENIHIQKIDRFKFYERTKKAFALIATSEQSLYANLILKKGVVKTE
ncbi:MAG: RbsD/FucU domain-containing protein [Candidatus Pacebacteria bacterium]|nr:RbsD/FucU domain-containing protein [Candidatus Paceibacterota bacterium]